MSRQIDMSDPSKLSQEDLEYLDSRGALPRDLAVKLAEKRGVASTPGGESRATPGGAPEVAGSDGGDAEADFEDMTVAELKEVARSQGLKTSGTKEELLARLNGEEEEDDEDE